jgi:DivIVA domain-containing protein
VSGDDIRSVKFHQRLRGYDPDAVDVCLEHLARMLDNGARPLASDVVGLHFPIRLRGYDREEVDTFLDRVLTESR